MRRLALAWLLAAVIFLTLDALWLAFMTPRLYRSALAGLLREDFDLLPALLFYLLYLSGIACLAIAPALRSLRVASAAWRGALLGLVSYGTYDLTNQATLVGWPWHVTVADLAWGGAASAVTSALSCAATLAIERRWAGTRR
ncbi:MAG: DUF2177 family protein [Proteobacteria bacterium]|nr:DUF2177 family protein [Pseudomonadota bacterium]